VLDTFIKVNQNKSLICRFDCCNNCSACKPAWCGLLGLKYSDWFSSNKLQEKIGVKTLIYLDNAATTKPNQDVLDTFIKI
jgi:hypothetical protein